MNILRISNSKTFVAEPFFTTKYLKTDVFSRQMIFCFQNFRKKLFLKHLQTRVSQQCIQEFGRAGEVYPGSQGGGFHQKPQCQKQKKICLIVSLFHADVPAFFALKSLKMKSAFCKYHLAKICLQLWSILKSFFELLLIPESKVQNPKYFTYESIKASEPLSKSCVKHNLQSWPEYFEAF